ncbi:MAG: lamin tail domain-containing protein [Acidimicrobiales bacterium]
MASVVLLGAQPASAAPSDVVISELMYNPADEAPVEFLEVANRGETPEDISGWCLATGISFCFPADTVIEPGQHLVVTDELAAFPDVYGATVVPVGEYSGGLSNGGETVELLDDGGALIDIVDYDDASPWPAAPDGNGPSLELVDLSSDNNQAESWLTSIAASGNSVGAPNSVTGVVFPTVEDVTADPFRPTPNQPVTVSARLSDSASATLSYVIDWQAEQTITMADDESSVGGADDGVWSAVIPGQQAGDLIRYRVDVTSPEGIAAGAPDPTDTINYLGVVVVDESISTNLPLLEWFMEDSVHDDILENHRFDNVTGEAVISYDGAVIDNVEMRIRGNTSRFDNKVSWKVEFPKGYLFDMGGLLDEPVDEFNMQQSQYVNEELGWGTADAAGLLSLQYFKMRTHRNGEFYSVATHGGTYDGRWRDNNGRDEWALYKAEQELGRAHPSEQALIDSGDWDKKEGDDDDWGDLHELTAILNSPPNQSQEDWMWENLNVSQFVNYAAVLSVLRHSDSGWYNYYVTRDSPDTGRWEMMLWDMDTMFRTEAVDSNADFVVPGDNGQRFLRALTNHPEFRQMYFRRVRTLIDRFLQPNDYEERADGLLDTYLAEYELDYAIWGGETLEQERGRLFQGITERRADIAENLAPEGSWGFPPSASGQTPIEIAAVNHAPAEGDNAEFIELRNTSSTESIDLSAWQIDGAVTATIASGTVLVPNGQLYLVADDNTFRSINGATSYVADEFDGSLPDAGGSLLLLASDGSTVDSVNFPIDSADSAISGAVTNGDGSAAEGVAVDLFLQNERGGRGQFLDSARTNASGQYTFSVNPGCHVLTFTAPEGQTFDGSQWFQPSICVEPGETAVIDAALDGAAVESAITGTVNAANGSGVEGVQIDLFQAAADGSRGTYLRTATTDSEGNYSFTVEPACHVLTFTAPEGQSFDGRRWFQPSTCVEPGQTVVIDAALD